jgi:site-specific DNA-methyltransferase (adenine-specific)
MFPDSIPAEYRNSLVQTDALTFLRSLPDASVPLFLFSPPYNLGNSSGGAAAYARRRGHYPVDAPHGKRGGNGRWYGGPLAGYDVCSDNLPWSEYIAWQHAIVSECWRALSDGGAIFYVHKPRVIDGVLFDPDMFIPKELPIRQRVIRALGSGINNNPTAYCPAHEEILIIAKPDFRLRDRAASGAGSVWYIPPEQGLWHPAPFPLALAQRVVETTMPAFVCDPFAGSGTTACAAKQCGIDFIGCDLSADYVARANERIARTRRMTLRQAALVEAAEQEVLW